MSRLSKKTLETMKSVLCFDGMPYQSENITLFAHIDALNAELETLKNEIKTLHKEWQADFEVERIKSDYLKQQLEKMTGRHMRLNMRVKDSCYCRQFKFSLGQTGHCKNCEALKLDALASDVKVNES